MSSLGHNELKQHDLEIYLWPSSYFQIMFQVSREQHTWLIDLKTQGNFIQVQIVTLFRPPPTMYIMSNYLHTVWWHQGMGNIFALCEGNPAVTQLTHWGLVAPYGDIDLGQHWFRQWLVAWRHQAITWTNVDVSLRSCGIHLRTLS